MFAPNRLLTTKEQWLLVGVIVAILTGCATLFLHDFATQSRQEEAPVAPSSIIRTQPRAQAVAAPPEAVLPDAAQTRREEPDATTSDAASVPEAPETIGVAIMGAVRRPNFYWVHSDMRVADLITRAGGAMEHADLSDIVLTAPLVDETTLTIPELPEVRRDTDGVYVRRRNSGVAVNPPWYRRSALSASVQYSETQETPSPHAAPQGAAAATASGAINLNQASQQQLETLPGIGPVLAGRIIAERERQPFRAVEELTRVPGIADKRLEAIRSLVTAP